MGSKQFNQQLKLIILEKAKEIGVKEAAKIVGVHYTSIYDLRRKLEALGQKAFLAHQPRRPGRFRNIATGAFGSCDHFKNAKFCQIFK